MPTPNDDLVAASLAVADNKTLDVQPLYKPTETCKYTHFSSSHPLSVKKSFIKGDTLRLLRTNSVKETFELRKLEFLTHLLERGFPRTRRKYFSRSKLVITKRGSTKMFCLSSRLFNPVVPNLRKVLLNLRHLIRK